MDQDLSFFAASPDGLVENNDLVQTKCPASAKSMRQKTKSLRKK